MNRAAACAGAAVAAFGVGLLPATASAAASASANPAGVTSLQSGYWWQSQPAGNPLPPPPQVPQNGIWVASDPSGTQALAAIRFTLGFGMSAPVLSLVVSEAQPAQQLSVVACPVATASTQWKSPGTAGAWSSRPAADCSNGSVAGQLSADGKTMRFDLSKLPSGNLSTINVVILPAAIPSAASVVPGTPATTSPTFDLAFDPVTPSDVAAVGGAASNEAPAADTASQNVPESPSTDQSSTASVAPVVTGPVTGASSFASAPSAPAPAPVVATPTAPASSGPPQVALAVTAGAHGSSNKTPTTRQRWILMSVLVDLALFAAWEERRRQGGAGRLRLSLYEIPGVANREAARQLERDGSPPPLR